VTHAGIRLRNCLIFFHRWFGVLVCLVFLIWFASGAILMYWDFPGVNAADRLGREPVLDGSRILISPDAAFKLLQTDRPPDELHLVTFDGHPVYRFVFEGEPQMVRADDGLILSEFPPQLTLRIAAAWTGLPPADAKAEANTEEDQWTVAGEFQAWRPLRKYSWPNGEEVYVSTVTGDVVQYTTRSSRIGAYLGAIPHWLYFTPLRKHGPTWRRVVIWTSGLGTITALLGFIIGVWIYSPAKRFPGGGTPARIPYTGQKRWHLILGLFFGPLAISWVFSGMLSMDPFLKMQSGNSQATEAPLAEALRGSPIRLTAYDAKPPREAIRQAAAAFEVRELELTSLAGQPYFLATGESHQQLVIPLDGEPTSEFDRTKIFDVLRKAASPNELTAIRAVTEYESYYLDRRNRLPLPALFVQLNDSERSMYYVDPKTARIVRSYNLHSRWNRWFYRGLHSIDLPWLYKHRPAWDIVVLVLLAGGESLCVTSFLLAWSVVGRKVRGNLERPS